MSSIAHHAIAIRLATASDIDALTEIDNDASVLFERAGLRLDFTSDHEFAVNERDLWTACVRAGTTLLAIDARGERAGFAAVASLDGEPYLEQLAVRSNSMRQGIGTALVEAAARLATNAGGSGLWLTTYDHLSWNRPFYERRGFQTVPAKAWGAEIAAQIRYQRQWLPHPDARVVMRRGLCAN